MEAELKRVYVISAPSGTGKTTLNRMLAQKHPEFEIAVSLTTRPMRAGDIDGKDYKFVTKEQFQQCIDQNQMLEWANVHGNLYGTSKQQLHSIEQRGHYSLLEIDVQGWRQAQSKLKKATSIFILPPSLLTLWKRLEKRGTDSLQTRWQRLCNARDEIAAADTYHFFIINSDLDEAYYELESIVLTGQNNALARERGLHHCQQLMDEFNHGSWLLELKEKFQHAPK